jgi:hypothetical protein
MVEENFDQLLRKEKDEASSMNCFHRDSQDAFIPRFAGVWKFFIFKTSKLRAGLSIVKQFREKFSRNKIERSA